MTCVRQCYRRCKIIARPAVWGAGPWGQRLRARVCLSHRASGNERPGAKARPLRPRRAATMSERQRCIDLKLHNSHNGATLIVDVVTEWLR